MALIGGGVAWHQLGIRQIAERARISRTAFYDFFASKNEVLEHLITGLHDDLAAIVTEPVPDGVSATDLAHLRSVLSRIADFNTKHGAVYCAFLDATGDDARLEALWHDLAGIYTKVVVAAVERARAAHPGAPATPDGEALARVLLVMTERTMLMLLRAPDGEQRRDELLEALALVWERAVFGRAL